MALGPIEQFSTWGMMEVHVREEWGEGGGGQQWQPLRDKGGHDEVDRTGLLWCFKGCRTRQCVGKALHLAVLGPAPRCHPWGASEVPESPGTCLMARIDPPEGT